MPKGVRFADSHTLNDTAVAANVGDSQMVTWMRDASLSITASITARSRLQFSCKYIAQKAPPNVSARDRCCPVTWKMRVAPAHECLRIPSWKTVRWWKMLTRIGFLYSFDKRPRLGRDISG